MHGIAISTETARREQNALHSADRCSFRILFADAARDHRGGRHPQPKSDGDDQGQHRLGEPDGGYCVRAQTSDPEDIDHGEERFENHLEHHGNREKQDGAVQAAGCEVTV